MSHYPDDIDVARDTLVCRTSGWKDILLFLVLNYGAHAFTIVSSPWESRTTFLGRIVGAICIPASGMGLAGTRIFSGCRWYRRERGKTSPQEKSTEELRKAHYAGVLGTLAIGRRIEGGIFVELIAPRALVNALNDDPLHKIQSIGGTRPFIWQQSRRYVLSNKSRGAGFHCPYLAKFESILDLNSR